MAKVKATARFQIIEFLDKFIDGATADSIGKEIIGAAKEAIAEGQSPVRGEGRFERYKDRKKYPGDLKEARPVNLNLTGEMLANFSHRRKDNTTIEVGITGGSPRAKKLAKYHNEGTEFMAKRQFIPQEGQEFTVRIMRVIRELYSNRLALLIKRANKKS